MARAGACATWRDVSNVTVDDGATVEHCDRYVAASLTSAAAIRSWNCGEAGVSAESVGGGLLAMSIITCGRHGAAVKGRVNTAVTKDKGKGADKGG